MSLQRLRQILEDYRLGGIDQETVLDLLTKLPYEDLEFARVDHHRGLRRGFPEVIFGETKPAGQIVEIMRAMQAWQSDILVTRVEPAKADDVASLLPGVIYHRVARVLVWTHPDNRDGSRSAQDGIIQVICAGSSDIPVAEEAAITAEVMGNRVERFYDVGVAGLHRLLSVWDRLQNGSAYVVVAGMEGALPSVVAGLVARPVIAVPTSVGYGASFGGLAALLGMLTSCSPGIAVVNIDNGFGAGYMASLINQCRDKPSGNRRGCHSSGGGTREEG
ncbi:MAG TPA: nickel pincer cofactor biosynthesis protein LarB [Syntrophobacteraceae bacterium]|nr:nickel pincer cofactor biosynthesis protein LarB [Syntrophobacteraceae bacterium]HBZ56053.1 nickel pincer cofactor biosynthesis protein LarB [Syntrophobacteraceae bacterium]